MRLAVVGPGRIGSALAFCLARADHDVTVVGRGARLAQIERDGAIVTTRGERAPVAAAATLGDEAWELVLVTVSAAQIEPLLPSLAASRARTFLFLLNTFLPREHFVRALGRERLTLGFPSLMAQLRDGRAEFRLVTRGQLTTVESPRWAELLNEAGIVTVVCPDMESWLRTHAVFILPLLALGVRTVRLGRGPTWAEASLIARAWPQGLVLVQALGHPVLPPKVAWFQRVPEGVLALACWVLGRTPVVRQVGEAGASETEALLDQIQAAVAAVPPTAALTAALRAVQALRPPVSA